MNLSATQALMPTRKDLSFQKQIAGIQLKMPTEADRCLQCKHQPCVTACPIHVLLNLFKNKKDDLETAYEIITSRSIFLTLFAGLSCSTSMPRACVKPLRKP